MLGRPWQQRIADIVEAAADIQQFIAGMSVEHFLADKKTIRAVAFQLALIGEAAREIPPEIRVREPSIP